MNEKDIICQYAKELKLATVRENLSLFVEDAMREQWGYLMFLRRLFEEEVTSRREKSKIIRIHRADFPQMKYLEELKREELPLEGRCCYQKWRHLSLSRRDGVSLCMAILVQARRILPSGLALRHALKDIQFSLHPCHTC